MEIASSTTRAQRKRAIRNVDILVLMSIMIHLGLNSIWRLCAFLRALPKPIIPEIMQWNGIFGGAKEEGSNATYALAEVRVVPKIDVRDDFPLKLAELNAA